MSYLGLGSIAKSGLLCGLLAVGIATSVGCKSDGGGDAGGAGGDGNGGDGGSNSAGKGGGGVAGSGGGTSGGSAGMSPGGMAGADMPDAGPPPPPEPVMEPYAAASATSKLPITISFKTADDLKKNFAVVGEVAQSADSEGVLKIAKGKSAVLTFDTTPDTTRTDTFEDFTATMKVHSEHIMEGWFTIATDKNRNDGQTIRFGENNGVEGPPGVSDVDHINFTSKCWAVTLIGNGPQCIGPSNSSYGWTAFEPSMTPQTFKITVRANKDAKTIKVRGELIDGTGTPIDGTPLEWTDVLRVNGELTFGIYAAGSDAFIDEISINAAELLPESGVVGLTDAPLHVWIPPALAKLKGLFVVAPDLIQLPKSNADIALFEHFRRFATAYGWGILGGVRSGPKEFPMFKDDLAKLATKAGHPEMNTVPVFIHSLLNFMPYQALADETFNKRLIGFHADKPRLGGDVNISMAEKPEDYPMSAAGRAVPGFVMYAQRSVISTRSSMFGFWWKDRFFGNEAGASTEGFALWNLMGHNFQTNAVVDSWMMYLAFLQEAITLRTKDNDGITPLKPVDKSKAFLGYSEFFNLKYDGTAPVVSTFLPGGYPAAGTTGDQLTKPTKEFLIGPSTALVWQAFEYYRQSVPADAKSLLYKPVFWLTVPNHGKVGESRLMKLGLNASLDGWTKIEFFDSASKDPFTVLKTVAAGGTPEFNYTALTLGAHNFIAKVTAKDGKFHFTHPVMAIFTP
jgi:hypothetical protein